MSDDEMEVTELPPSLASVYIMLQSSENTSLRQSYSQTNILPQRDLRNRPEHQLLVLRDSYDKYVLPLVFPKLSVSQVSSCSRTWVFPTSSQLIIRLMNQTAECRLM
jgi:hypothetical protein